MSDLEKYCDPIIRFTTRFRDFNIQSWALRTLPTECRGVYGWRVGARREVDHIYWFFELPRTNPDLKVRVFYFMKAMNHKFKEREPKFYGYGHFTPEDRIHAHSMITADIMNPENGWLQEDESFSLEFRVYVESIDDGNGIWRFNFYQRNKTRSEKNQEISMWSVDKSYELSFSKQLLYFHSLRFYQQNSNIFNGLNGFLPKSWFTYPSISEIDDENIEKFLQIVHGVQLRLTELEISAILDIAYRHGFKNVVRYCEHQLIQNQNLDYSPEDSKFQWAFTYGLNRYLLHLLTTYNIKLDSFGKVLILWNFREMSAEAMKLLVKKFLYEES